jgi:hypothetical protein
MGRNAMIDYILEYGTNTSRWALSQLDEHQLLEIYDMTVENVAKKVDTKEI